MLAPTIGTMHGPNKGKPGSKVKLQIDLAHTLLKIANSIDERICFVIHGASTLYQEVTSYAISSLRKFESAEASVKKWEEFVGTDWNRSSILFKLVFVRLIQIQKTVRLFWLNS